MKVANEWAYLESHDFRARYLLAAHFLAACPRVIEIGANSTTIADFLVPVVDKILVCDPLQKSRLDGAVEYLQGLYQHQIDYFHQFVQNSRYGLCMLGLDYEFDPAIVQLVLNADRTVLDLSIGWARAEDMLDKILNATGHRIAIDLILDFSGLGVEYRVHNHLRYRRRLVVLEASL